MEKAACVVFSIQAGHLKSPWCTFSLLISAVCVIGLCLLLMLLAFYIPVITWKRLLVLFCLQADQLGKKKKTLRRFLRKIIRTVSWWCYNGCPQDRNKYPTSGRVMMLINGVLSRHITWFFTMAYLELRMLCTTMTLNTTVKSPYTFI